MDQASYYDQMGFTGESPTPVCRTAQRIPVKAERPYREPESDYIIQDGVHLLISRDITISRDDQHCAYSRRSYGHHLVNFADDANQALRWAEEDVEWHEEWRD